MFNEAEAKKFFDMNTNTISVGDETIHVTNQDSDPDLLQLLTITGGGMFVPLSGIVVVHHKLLRNKEIFEGIVFHELGHKYDPEFLDATQKLMESCPEKTTFLTSEELEFTADDYAVKHGKGAGILKHLKRVKKVFKKITGIDVEEMDKRISRLEELLKNK